MGRFMRGLLRQDILWMEETCISSYLGPAARAGLAAAPLAHPALVTWDVFLGFEDPDLSSLTERG